MNILQNILNKEHLTAVFIQSNTQLLVRNRRVFFANKKVLYLLHYQNENNNCEYKKKYWYSGMQQKIIL